jgi:hypothetical protein
VDRKLTSRVIAICAWLAALLPMLAAFALLAVFQNDFAWSSDLSLPFDDPNGATSLRWAGLANMVAYLPLAPVIIYVHRRLADRAPDLMGLLTFSGLASVLVGSLGGAVLTTFGPPLIEDGSEAARVTFAAFVTMVYVGLWEILTLIGFGVWLVGVGWLLRAESARFGTTGVIAGVASLVSAVRSGIIGGAWGNMPELLDDVITLLLVVVYPWLVWLGIRLYRGLAPAQGFKEAEEVG